MKHRTTLNNTYSNNYSIEPFNFGSDFNIDPATADMTNTNDASGFLRVTNVQQAQLVVSILVLLILVYSNFKKAK